MDLGNLCGKKEGKAQKTQSAPCIYATNRCRFVSIAMSIAIDVNEQILYIYF
jgi:hypothetical protein